MRKAGLVPAFDINSFMRNWINLFEGKHSGWDDEEEVDEFDTSLLGPTGTFRLFHAGHHQIKKFKPFIHLGTEKAALDLANEKYTRTGCVIHEVELTVTKSVEILDTGVGQHDVEGMMTYLETILNLDMNEVETVFRNPVASAKLLARYGYDALLYRNRREDPGSISFVALDPSKIKLIGVDHF